MNPTAIALTGYLLWTLLLLGGILGLRTYLSLTGQHPANRFKPDGSDVSYNLAGSEAHAQAVLAAWSGPARERALLFLGLDYLYLFTRV